MVHVEELARQTIDCGLRIHKELGPGLLESVYEVLLAESLMRRGLKVDRQVPIDIRFDGLVFAEGFKADLLIGGSLLVEIKSVEQVAPVHLKQLLTYLRLSDRPLGLLLNFGGATFREGVRRVVNNHNDFASSRLRVHESAVIQVLPPEE